MSLASLSGGALRAALGASRVVVIGLGASGRAAATLCRQLGATVVGTDAAPREKMGVVAAELEALGVELALGGHDAAGLERADLIIVSPGVPAFEALAKAEARGVPAIGEIELATRLLPELPIVAITGSNGKSTTTMLVGELLAAAGRRPFVGGNLGDPPAAIVPRPGGPPPGAPSSEQRTSDQVGASAHDVLVLEISSFQAERMPLFHPRCAALLNLSPNHLDRYDSYEAYGRAKGNLFVNQRGDDRAVFPAGDVECERQARRGTGELVAFGRLGDPGVVVGFDEAHLVDAARGWTFERGSLRLAGEHNAMNVCAALALTSPWSTDRAVVADVLARFQGLPHRVARVADVGGVTYYDDSKGTSVGAAVAAIVGLPEAKIVLVAGGRDKLGSYDSLVDAMVARGRGAVLIGEAADRLAAALGDAVPLRRASSMGEAVRAASELARAGDAVLLSPACSSFDMFRDYKHRGDAFVEAVHELRGASPRGPS